MINQNEFVKGYVDAALWSTTDCCEEQDIDYNLDDCFNKVSERCFKAMQKDCSEFIKENETDLRQFKTDTDCDDFRLGFLFWLNRCRHGVGFWEEDTLAAERLSTAAHQYGDFPLYGDFEEGVVKSHHWG